MWLPGDVSVFHVYLGPSIYYFFYKACIFFGLYIGFALCLFYFFWVGHINKPCVMAMLKFLLCLCFNLKKKKKFNLVFVCIYIYFS